MNFPTISVLMPVYNAGDYIFEAIESILNQSFENFDLLIINDGSTDNSKEIINGFNDSRIRYIENTENVGLIDTLNVGLKHCNGEFIARMDADDISHPERFIRQYKFLLENPEYGVVGSSLNIIDSEGKLIKKRSYPKNDLQTFENIVRARHTSVHAAALYRKSVFDLIGGYNHYLYAEDIDLWFRIYCTSFKTINLEEALYNYRQHDDQVTSDENIVQKDSYRLAFNHFINKMSGMSFSKEQTDIYLDVVRWKKIKLDKSNYKLVTQFFDLIVDFKCLNKKNKRVIKSNFYKEFVTDNLSIFHRIISKVS